jgi:hypothetical protein
MAKKFEAAEVRLTVPSKKWKSKAEVEAWARDQLAGGPPSLRASVPEGHPDAGKRATWRHVREGALAGQVVTLVSDPPGLIVVDTDTAERKYVPSASRTGLTIGKTDAGQFIGSIEEERALRNFVRQENELFNKTRQRQSDSAKRNWTLVWYHHGQSIRRFVREHPQAFTERVWQELVKWGKGKQGYSRQTHQDATYFYDWLGDVSDEHPIFRFGTTRIQHILWADRTKLGRDRLLSATLSGALSGLSDDEFAWVMGKRTKNWPLDEASLKELLEIGKHIRTGSLLDEGAGDRLVQIIGLTRRQWQATADAVAAGYVARDGP